MYICMLGRYIDRRVCTVPTVLSMECDTSTCSNKTCIDTITQK